MPTTTLETVMPESRVIRAVYVIQSRPAPGQPWRATSERPPEWLSLDEARGKLADRRRMQPSWEHRLVEVATTITVTPVPEP